MLVTSNLLFSHNVFIGLLFQIRWYPELWGKGLTLPKDRILYLTKSEALADDKLNVAKTLISDLDRKENIVGKGENAGYQHFLLFPQSFQMPTLFT